MGVNVEPKPPLVLVGALLWLNLRLLLVHTALPRT
jgi:hypothetical protein